MASEGRVEGEEAVGQRSRAGSTPSNTALSLDGQPLCVDGSLLRAFSAMCQTPGMREPRMGATRFARLVVLLRLPLEPHLVHTIFNAYKELGLDGRATQSGSGLTYDEFCLALVAVSKEVEREPRSLVDATVRVVTQHNWEEDDALPPLPPLPRAASPPQRRSSTTAPPPQLHASPADRPTASAKGTARFERLYMTSPAASRSPASPGTAATSRPGTSHSAHAASRTSVSSPTRPATTGRAPATTSSGGRGGSALSPSTHTHKSTGGNARGEAWGGSHVVGGLESVPSTHTTRSLLGTPGTVDDDEGVTAGEELPPWAQKLMARQSALENARGADAALMRQLQRQVTQVESGVKRAERAAKDASAAAAAVDVRCAKLRASDEKRHDAAAKAAAAATEKASSQAGAARAAAAAAAASAAGAQKAAASAVDAGERAAAAVAALEGQLGELEALGRDTAYAVTAASDSAAAAAARTSVLESQLSSMQRVVTAAAAAAPAAAAQLAQIAASIDAVEAKVARMQARGAEQDELGSSGAGELSALKVAVTNMEAQLSALDAYIAEHTAQVQQASEASAEELLGHVQSLHAEHAQALAQVQQQVKQQAQQLAQAQAAEQALQQEQAAKKRPGSRAPSELKAASAAKPSAQAPPPKLPSRLSSGALAGAPAAADSGADSATAAAAVAAVTDVASRLDALGAQVAALEANARAAASGAGADATAAGADVVLLHRVATLEADVQALASAAGAAPSVGSAGSGSYAAVAQRVATLEADMQALASATSAAPTVGTGAGAGAGSDAALTQRLAVLEANMVTQVSAAGTAAPAAAAALTAGADGALAQRVATLEADVQALASASGAAAPAGAAPLSAGADAAMAQRVATLDADMEALASAAGSAVANSASMSSALADVFQRVEELEEALGAVSGGVAVGGDAHAAIAQLSAQLQNLEAELHAGLGEANALAADAGAEAAGEAAAHIMTLIAELGANVQRLSQAAEESDAAVAKVAQQQESLSLRVPLAAMGSQAAAAVTTVGNEEAMRKLRAEVAALAARLDAGGGGSSDAVRELQEKVDGLERQVAHSGAVVAPLIERQVQNMSRQMSRQSTSRNLDRAASNAALHEDTIGPLKQQVDELAARQEKDHAASMAASAAAVAEIAAAVSPMKQQLQELVTRQARQSAEIERLSGVHASMESLQERVAVQAEQAAKAVQLYVRVDGIEATVSQAAQAMQASQARVEVLEQQITFVAGQADADIGDIAARVSSLESGAASAAAVSELAARVEVLEGREAGEAPSDGQGMADVKRALAMLSVETCQQLQELKTASRPGTAAPGGPDVDDLSQALDVVSDKLNTRVNKLERLLGQGPAPLCCDNVIEAIEEINHNVSTLDALLRSSVEAYAAQQQKNLVPLFMTNGMPPPKAIPFDWAQPGGKFNAVNLSAVPSHSVLRAPGSGHNKHRDNAHSLNGGHGGGGHVYYAADDGGGGGGGGQVSTAAHDPASNRSSGDGGDSVVSSSDRREVKAPRTSLVIKQKVAPKHEDPPERKHLHSVGAGSSQLRARAASDASSTFDEWNQGAVRAGMSPPRMGMVPAGPGSKPVSMTGTVYTMGAASPANANTIPRPRTSSETGDHRSLATLPGGVRLSMNVRQSDNGGRQIHQYASMQQRTSEGGNGPQHFAHNAGHSMNGAGPSAGGGKTRAQYSLNSTALERSAGRL